MSEPENLIKIDVDTIFLQGDLQIPEKAVGLVLFAHGSGSGRYSPRNRYVAQMLRQAGLATLLFDLLTLEEEEIDMRTLEYRFDIDLLAKRLVGVSDWVAKTQETKALRLGYFGASTGAAAALIAAASRPSAVKAVVSRGGRPDLAKESLSDVKAPTLLIVGGLDYEVIELNRAAFEPIPAEKEIAIIPGATHLFEESGTLEEVARLAAEWFLRYL